MSGPKGISYTIESPAQIEARLVAEWQTHLDQVLERFAELAARRAVLGLGTSTPTRPTCHDSGELMRAVQDLRARWQALEAEMNEEGARQHSARAARLLSDASAALTQRARIERPTDREVAPAPAGADPDVVAKVESVLTRARTGVPGLQESVDALLASPPATARLLLADLSATIDQANRDADLARSRIAAAAEDEERRKATAAAEDCDRAFVLARTVSALTELGYVVAGTSVVQSDAVVLRSPALPGGGVRARIDGSGEIEIVPVRSPDSSATSVAGVEDELCSHLDSLTATMRRGGIATERVRSMPTGILPLAEEALPALAVLTPSVRSFRDRAPGRQAGLT